MQRVNISKQEIRLGTLLLSFAIKIFIDAACWSRTKYRSEKKEEKFEVVSSSPGVKRGWLSEGRCMLFPCERTRLTLTKDRVRLDRSSELVSASSTLSGHL